MKFRLLGPVEVVMHDKVVTILAPRYEIVLTLLLLDANRVVSIERMIDALWSDRSPRTARRQVQIIVSGLRRLLPGTEIVTRPPGYLIKVDDEDLDLTCFEKLVARGTKATSERRVPEAIGLLRSALALWRGEAMEGIHSEVVRVAATRLTECRMQVLQDCLDLEIQNGGHCEVIGELTKFVAEHPMNERFRRQLMLALYWAGRQADALDVFRVGRQIMREELGIEPSAILCALERAILTRDRKIEPPANRHASDFAGKTEATIVPYQLPRTIADFTGRDEMLAEIAHVITGEEASGTFPRVVMLTGRGGTGKTAIAVRAAHMLSQHFPDGQLFLQFHADMTENRISSLEQLLLSLGVRPELIPARPEDRAAMYRSWLGSRRVLIVIDGAASKHQITPHLPGTGGCAAIVTSAHRIAGLEGVHQIDVGPLDNNSAFGLLATVIGANRVEAEREAGFELVRLCEGLPLALRIVAAKLNLRPHWRIGTMVTRLRDEVRRLDEFDLDGSGVRTTLTVAYEGLDKGARSLLERLSQIGAPDFASWVSAPLLDQDIPIAENLLQELVEAHLVEACVAEDGAVRFHLCDLVRIYTIEQLADDKSTAERSDPVRRLLHCWLYLVTTAHRRVYGSDYNLLHGTAVHRPLPDGITEELLREPAKWVKTERDSLLSAISLAAQLGMDELCWDLAVTAMALLAPGLSSRDWRDPHAIALDVVRNSHSKRGEGALLYSLGTLEAGVNIITAAGYFEQSLAKFNEIADSRGRALALTGLALVSRLNGDFALSLQQNQEALICFRDTGDLFSEAYTLTAIALNYIDARDFGSAEHEVNEALATLRILGPAAPGAARLTARIQHALAEFQLQRGREELAVDSYESALRLSRDVSDVIGEGYALVGLGTAMCALGDFAGAEYALSAAMDLANTTGHRLIRGRSLLALAEIDHARRRDPLAVARIDEAIKDLRELGAKGPWQARALELRVSIARHAWQAATELAERTDPALAEQFARMLNQLRAVNEN